MDRKGTGQERAKYLVIKVFNGLYFFAPFQSHKKYNNLNLMYVEVKLFTVVWKAC
jgi:hypothetical protein